MGSYYYTKENTNFDSLYYAYVALMDSSNLRFFTLPMVLSHVTIATIYGAKFLQGKLLTNFQ